MIVGPCLQLTEPSALYYGIWSELPGGIFCKLYKPGDWLHAYLDFRLICPMRHKIHEQGSDILATYEGQCVELLSCPTYCLLIVYDEQESR